MSAHLSIQLDISLARFVNEHGVGHAMLSHPRIDALYPQPAEIPLLVLEFTRQMKQDKITQ